MAKYSADTEQIARGYNITPEETILSFAIAAGAPTADAYRIIMHQPAKTTQQENQALCNSLLTNKPGIKILISRIKNHRNPATLKKEDVEKEIINNEKEEEKEERRNEYKTRDGLIRKLIDSVIMSQGKEQITGLTTLAKMQGFEKPEEQEQEEKRKYFLPWVSNCRSCELMKLYKKIVNEQTQ